MKSRTKAKNLQTEMGQKGMPLQQKILLANIILLAVIGGMAAILFFDWIKIRKIEAEGEEVQAVQQKINAAHRKITVLATMGESVMAWNDYDYSQYHAGRLATDSLLQELKSACTTFVNPAQIDTLRVLLEEKENHLLRIMETFHEQEIADSLIAKRLPEITVQTSRTKTIIRKKKGIAGWFGKKDTLHVPIPTSSLRSLNDRLISMQEERIRNLDAYADSLRLYNRELNRKLYSLIAQLDTQAQEALVSKKDRIQESELLSFRLIAGVVGVAILLLIISHFVIVHDLRRRERDRTSLEDALKQNRALSDIRKKIIVTLSHDIRGPLNAISGSAELAMDTRDRKRRNVHLENILDTSRHITRLANSLLDLSRLNEAKETLNRIPFRLDSFLENLSEEYVRMANDKCLLFKTDLHHTEVTVEGDADRIEQVIGNLLGNAIKFTKAGTVCLYASHEDNVLTVKVEDTGIGMDEKTVQRIFRPFERAAPEMDPEGFGLGLSITKGLVSLLEGEISVESHAGEGSIFTVRIPLPASDKETVENTAAAAEVRLRLPKRVLAVDDDPIQLRNVGEMLERNGITCHTCLSAKEVISALRKEKYDLLLADIQMRGTGGFELLRLLRRSNIGNSRTIPVAAMTARNDEGQERYTEAGFSGCIRKPFSMRELLEFIAGITEHDEEEGNPVDFKALAPEVEDREWVLSTFMEESCKEMAELREALSYPETTGYALIRKILHRMYPVWVQLGIEHELEACDRMLHEENPDRAMVRKHTEEIILRLQELTAEAERCLSERRERKAI